MTGRLLYVMGASGSGKDTLIKAASHELANRSGIHFARRYITRPPDPDGENHLPLDREAFSARVKDGLFAMHWFANGHAYGIDMEINNCLSYGETVVVNGSRIYCAQAQVHYPNIETVLIDVSPSILRHRLQSRGRESSSEIEARLLRHQSLQEDLNDSVVINNDGALTVASRAFIDLICHPTRDAFLCK